MRRDLRGRRDEKNLRRDGRMGSLVPVAVVQYEDVREFAARGRGISDEELETAAPCLGHGCDRANETGRIRRELREFASSNISYHVK